MSHVWDDVGSGFKGCTCTRESRIVAVAVAVIHFKLQVDQQEEVLLSNPFKYGLEHRTVIAPSKSVLKNAVAVVLNPMLGSRAA